MSGGSQPICVNRTAIRPMNTHAVRPGCGGACCRPPRVVPRPMPDLPPETPEQRLLLSELVRDSPVVFIRWRLEPGLPVEYVSENISQFGYAAQELLSGAVSLGELIDEDPYAGADTAPSMTHPGYRRLEYRLKIRPSGTKLVRFQVRTVHEAPGRIYCQGSMKEVVESMQHQQWLQLLEHAIEMAQNGIIISDARRPDMPVIYANPAVERNTGYAVSEILGRNCRFLQGEDRDQPGLVAIRKSLQDRRPCEVRLRNYRKDGSLFWNEVKLSPVLSPCGEVTHFIGIQSDITARKNAEDTLSRRDAILEAMSYATEMLLRSDDYMERLPAAMRQIGEVTGADHLCIWRVAGAGIDCTLNLQHAWNGPRLEPYSVDDWQGIPWGNPESWPSAPPLQQGKWVQGSLDHASPEERALVVGMGVQSFLGIPIFDGPQHLWGILSLGSVSPSVIWAVSEIEALQSVTRVLGAIIHSSQIDQALRASEQRFRTLSAVSPVGIFEADASGKVLYTNARLQEVFGVLADAFANGEWRKRLEDQSLQTVVAEWERTVRAGRPFRAEFMIRQPQGGVRWVKSSATPMHGPKGEVTGYVGTIDDFTEYQAANDALRKSEAQYRSLVTNLKEVVFQTDASGNWSFLNQAWQEITGFTVAESLGKLFLDYVHPDDRERNNQLFLPLIRREKDYCRHEVRYLAKKGGYRWIEVFARLTLDAGGAIVGTSGTLTDITARREAEDLMRRQSTAIETAVDGIAILNHEGVYSYLNSTHLSLFGYASGEELVGKTWRELYAPEEIAEIEQRVFPQLKREGTWRGTMRARRRDGTFFDEELSLTMVGSDGLVCVCRDITERRLGESRIQKSLLEKDVMLKEIHHRVKNNMQIVSSLLNLQLEHIRDEATRALFIDSQNRIASMALVHEKLYQSANLAEINFRDYIEDLTESVVGSQGTRASGIEFRVDADEFHLGIDTAIPCGLLLNELISNAYKHAFPRSGPGRITLRLQRPAPGRLRFEVADTGCGLPEDFDLRRSRSLGMQLVATLVHQLRGSLEIDRTGGTRFVLDLQEVPQKRFIS
ncbi:hypothetical protein DB347_08665 [Opitutaceae bacterium EW11]|nr:hypothetical protein DB347_08665 [Opitutaceae bacterium EW11]